MAFVPLVIFSLAIAVYGGFIAGAEFVPVRHTTVYVKEPSLPSPEAPVLNITLIEPTNTPKPVQPPTREPLSPTPPFPYCATVPSGDNCTIDPTATPTPAVAEIATLVPCERGSESWGDYRVCQK